MNNTIQPINIEQGNEELKALLKHVRTKKSPTTHGVIICGTWLGTCLKLGWEKSQLDALELLWWSAHDRNGKLITTQTTKQNRYANEKESNETNPQAAEPIEARS